MSAGASCAAQRMDSQPRLRGGPTHSGPYVIPGTHGRASLNTDQGNPLCSLGELGGVRGSTVSPAL